MEGLTLKQKKFVQEYIKLGNATQAALNAGYSKPSASSIGVENLQKPKIKEAIQKVMIEKDKQLIAGQNEVLEFLTSVMRGENQQVHNKTVKTVRGEKQEIETIGSFTPREETRVDAAKELLKRYVAISSDETKARVRKLEADAKLSEIKLEMLTGDNDRTAEQIEKFLDLVDGEL